MLHVSASWSHHTFLPTFFGEPKERRNAIKSVAQASDYFKSHLAVGDYVAKTERLVQQEDVTALGFSDKNQLALYFHQSREFRVWNVASEPFDPSESDIAVATKVKVGTAISAQFIRPDLVLLGTSEGTLALIDWPMRTVIGQLKLDYPIKEIYACQSRGRLLINHGWANGSTGLLGRGINLLQWVDCKVTEDMAAAATGVASRFTARFKAVGHKAGAAPIIGSACDRLAFLEVMPARKGEAERKWVCVYSMSEPNMLLRCLEQPLQASSLTAFDESGRFIYCTAANDTYVVIDLEQEQSTLVGTPDVVAVDGLRRRHQPAAEVIPISKNEFATISEFGKVSLFKLPECTEVAQKNASDNELAVRNVLRSVHWDSPSSLGMSQRAKFDRYESGILTLKGLVNGDKLQLPITHLRSYQRELIAWRVGGPTEVTEWPFVRGTIGTRRGSQQVTLAKLLRCEAGYAIFEQNGAQIQVKHGDLQPAARAMVDAMTAQRFQNCLPVLQHLKEMDVRPPTPIEGKWVITEGQMFRYQIPDAYPRPEDRTVTIAGNQIRFPVFSQPPGNVRFEVYRYVFYPRDKLMFRITDVANGDGKMLPLRFDPDGRSRAEIIFPGGKTGMRLRRQQVASSATSATEQTERMVRK